MSLSQTALESASGAGLLQALQAELRQGAPEEGGESLVDLWVDDGSASLRTAFKRSELSRKLELIQGVLSRTHECSLEDAYSLCMEMLWDALSGEALPSLGHDGPAKEAGHYLALLRHIARAAELPTRLDGSMHAEMRGMLETIQFTITKCQELLR